MSESIISVSLNNFLVFESMGQYDKELKIVKPPCPVWWSDLWLFRRIKML